MIKINKQYLYVVKQELVNDVANTPNIIPEVLIGYNLPKPTVKVKYQQEKKIKRLDRRRYVSNIWNEHSNSNAIQLIDEFHEQELSDLILQFPKYEMLLQRNIFQRLKDIIQR